MEDNASAPPKLPEKQKPAAGKRILFVEDDALIARIYSQKLKEEGFEVAVAVDGLEAMKQLPGWKPDLMVLDLMMPRMTGPDVLKFMRQRPDMSLIRVIVFTNSFIGNLLEQVASLKVEQVLVKAAVTPSRLVEEINKMLAGPPPLEIAAKETSAPAVEIPKRRSPVEKVLKPVPGAKVESKPEPKPQPKPEPKREAKSQPEPTAAPVQAKETDSEFLKRIGEQFLERTPAIFNELRGLCREFLAATEPIAQAEQLATINRKLGFLTQISAMAGYQRTAELASALDALVYELANKPSLLNDSVRQTIAATIALMARSFDNPTPVKEGERVRTAILVVDDDVISNRAVVDALGRARLAATSLADPAEALKLLQQQAFNVVLLDISMPGMDGTELCEQMRKVPFNKRTPVIFVTSSTDFPTRARTVLSGGDDLITKPILPTELCVKVLAHLLKTA